MLVRDAHPDDAVQVAAENAASELGCVAMEVTSARSRTGSHPFYQSLGYQDWGHRSARYLKDLPPAPP